jgi:hypothetical protein
MMSNALTLTKCIEGFGVILTTIIRTKILDLLPHLSLHEGFPLLETIENFRFISQEVDPHHLRVIVNERDIVLFTEDEKIGRFPYI